MNKLIVLLSFLFIYTASFSQEVTEDKFPMENSSLLWNISGNGMEHNAYLFGTIHIIPESQYFFPDTLLAINTGVDLVILEIDLGASMIEAMNKLMLEEGTFFDFVTPEQKDTILAWAEKTLDMTPSKFEQLFGKMKPFVIATLAMTSGGDEPMESYDLNITDHAKKAEIDIEGLETFEEQLDMFETTSREDQIEMLMAAIRDGNTTNEQTDEMTSIYLGQNIDSLYIFATAEGPFEMDQKIFLDDRNKRWIPKIIAAFTEQDVLIAVGAGHLGGPNGVVRLLRREGYTVTPIKL
ncbi:MAG: TraB/GumN family protein [Crocinitomicaceae bacterium]|nr:TraB/GumN family protein [Crocinitomicaceae bacterium]